MNQKGFTLIELVVVIVVLGILAAVAVPKFMDLSESAETAAVKAVAGGLGSASAINLAASKVTPAPAGVEDVTACADVINLVPDFDDAKYGVTGSITVNETGECTVTNKKNTSYTAKFTAYYVSI